MQIRQRNESEQKMKNLEERGKNYNVYSTAGARELACFVWGMMNGRRAYN